MKGTSATSNKVGSVTDIEKSRSNSQAKLMMENENERTNSSSVPMILLKLIVCTIAGIIFGISMEKARGKTIFAYITVHRHTEHIWSNPKDCSTRVTEFYMNE